MVGYGWLSPACHEGPGLPVATLQALNAPPKPRKPWRRGRMEALTDVLSALIPPVVVGGAFIYGVVKLVRSEAVGGRRNREDQPESHN
ncbi:hypothetical protein GCM10022224_073060 [Nonomuraea antimicrobica]|uniref:Uncharacterized protein n=1 Tax=Nonomuraea antimicrobica TaxID=561173 RepID=A0ABP7CY79_9ACTN